MSTPHVEIHIEELVLHGFAPGDRHRIAEGLERELARLVGSRGLSPSVVPELRLGHVDAGEFPIAAGASGHVVGSGAAGAVYRGLQSRGNELR
jgi:hypothetical protein